jgi:hypothetical protein
MGKSITDLLSVTTVGLDLAKHVFQVHCVELQVLASLTMDPPTGEECDAVREGGATARCGARRSWPICKLSITRRPRLSDVQT